MFGKKKKSSTMRNLVNGIAWTGMVKHSAKAGVHYSTYKDYQKESKRFAKKASLSFDKAKKETQRAGNCFNILFKMSKRK